MRGTFTPGRADSHVPHVGTYRRRLPVSLERLYENALDWQHLPHLHAGSFAALRCLNWGSWGWRAAVTDRAARESVIELCLDRDSRRWITRTLAGHGAGAEVWTVASPAAPRQVDIVVDFFVPGVADDRRVPVGEAFAALYARLYDEDVAMMSERQRELERRIDRARDGARELDLGPRSELRLPQRLELAGREFVLADTAAGLAAFPARCPHQLGPLEAANLDGTVVRCPWHGYRFDVVSGDNLAGGGCRLSHLPAVTITGDGHVRLVASH